MIYGIFRKEQSIRQNELPKESTFDIIDLYLQHSFLR